MSEKTNRDPQMKDDKKEDADLHCPSCQYEYDGDFSGRIFQDDIRIEGDLIITEIVCEGCGKSTYIRSRIESVTVE